MSELSTDVPEQLLSGLNAEQRQAVLHGSSPLLIVAGAGTGKTTTLSHRVAALIARGADPRRVLLLTFSRRAAAEMLRRVDGLLASMQQQGLISQRLLGRDVWGGTFHAVATRLLRRYGSLIGLSPEFTIVDRADAEDLVGAIRSELNLAKTHQQFPLKGTCFDVYSRCVNTQQPLEQVLKETFPWLEEHRDGLKQLFAAYTERKEHQQSLDYDDLLLFWQGLMLEPECAEVIRKQFDCVLVDEYQDTNTLQAEIIRELTPAGEGLTVVGDDAQSIYSFRAATVRNILDFPQQFPGTTLLPLEQNYRSTMPILTATNHVIALAEEGHRKSLWSQRVDGSKPIFATCADESEQSDYVIEQILSLRESGTPLRKQAVLFRAAHHSLALEVELSRRNIPFHKFGGLKFIEAAHIKDLLAFLRVAENPRDSISALRVLLLIPGIGPKKAAQLIELLLGDEKPFAGWSQFQPPAAARSHWPLLVALLRMLAGEGPKKLELPAQIHCVRTFYSPLLAEKFPDAATRSRDLEQLEQLSRTFESRGSFLSDLTLDPPSSTQDFAADPLLEEDYLVLSTIHSSKGLEWDAVYLLHAADGNLPSDLATRNPEEIEEERRLFYVALTRAKTWLTVIHPLRYYFHGRGASDHYSFSQRTRFLPDRLMGDWERVQVAAQRTGSTGELPATSVTTGDIRRRIGRMWT